MTVRNPSVPASAERAVLGAILADDKALGEVLGRLAASDFGDPRHAVTFQAVLDLAGAGKPSDLTILASHLGATGQTDAAGGLAYVASLADELPDPAAVEHYAVLVRDASRRRRLEGIAHALEAGAGDPERSVGDTIEAAGLQLAQLAGDHGDGGESEAYDAAGVAIEGLRREHGGNSRAVYTGFPALDTDLGGMRPRQLIVLAARTGVGKTALALQIARHAAVTQELSVAVFSLEMSRREIAERLLAQEAGVSLYRLRRGRLDANPRWWAEAGGELAAVGEAREVLQGRKLLLVDSGCGTPAAIRARARARRLRCGLDLVVVDYLQLLRSGERHGGRVEEVSAISRVLKVMAGELDVPVLALSQLNREPEKRFDGTAPTGMARTKGEPRLSDLRESGSIENDSDAVILLHRRLEGAEYEVRSTVAILAKNRHGSTGRYGLRFNPSRVAFEPGVPAANADNETGRTP